MQRNQPVKGQIINNLLMKKIGLLLVCYCITGCAFFIQACCKALCVKNDMQLQFIGFDRQDIDTLLLIKYESGGTFTAKIDSFYSDPFANGSSKDTLYGYLTNIDPGKDWEIKIPALNSTYRISDIQTTSERCECGGGWRKVITAYRLEQGNFVYRKYVELRK
jgi:hypothetical protein